MNLEKAQLTKFIKEIPLDIYYQTFSLGKERKIVTVGVKWGYCDKANQIFGRKNVLAMLDELENNKEAQKLLEIGNERTFRFDKKQKVLTNITNL